MKVDAYLTLGKISSKWIKDFAHKIKVVKQLEENYRGTPLWCWSPLWISVVYSEHNATSTGKESKIDGLGEGLAGIMLALQTPTQV